MEPLFGSATALSAALVLGLVTWNLTSKDRAGALLRQLGGGAEGKGGAAAFIDGSTAPLLRGAGAAQRGGAASAQQRSVAASQQRYYGSAWAASLPPQQQLVASPRGDSDAASSASARGPGLARKGSGIIRTVDPLLASRSNSSRALAAGLLSQAQPQQAAKRVRFAAPATE